MDSVATFKLILLAIFCAVITLVVQHHVGDLSIYRVQNSDLRAAMHEAILTNVPPPGETWSSIGANSTNVRMLTVYLAEALSSLSGVSPLRIYKFLDIIFLFTTLFLLFFFMRRWFSDEYSLLAVALLGCVLPLTMLNHAFQPWDRLSLLAWLLMLFAIRDDRLITFGLLLVGSILIKYDAVLLPGLYFLCHVSRSNWRKPVLITLVLFVISFGVFTALRVLIDGGFEPRPIIDQVLQNLRQIADLKNPHPSILGFVVPLILTAVGFRVADRFMRASAVFALFLFAPFFLATNFIEIRAQMPIFILVLPAATAGLCLLLQTSRRSQIASHLHNHDLGGMRLTSDARPVTNSN